MNQKHLRKTILPLVVNTLIDRYKYTIPDKGTASLSLQKTQYKIWPATLPSSPINIFLINTSDYDYKFEKPFYDSEDFKYFKNYFGVTLSRELNEWEDYYQIDRHDELYIDYINCPDRSAFFITITIITLPTKECNNED